MTRKTLSADLLIPARVARFRSKIEQRGPDECWLWTGAKNKQGYGRFRAGPIEGTKKHLTVRATRFMWLLAHGEDLGEENALHTCDNPPCCNPRHLFKGTALHNSEDMVDKGRQGPRGEAIWPERKGRSKLTPSDVAAIREALAAGTTQTSLATQYGVKRQTVGDIANGRSWQKSTV